MIDEQSEIEQLAMNHVVEINVKLNLLSKVKPSIATKLIKMVVSSIYLPGWIQLSAWTEQCWHVWNDLYLGRCPNAAALPGHWILLNGPGRFCY